MGLRTGVRKAESLGCVEIYERIQHWTHRKNGVPCPRRHNIDSVLCLLGAGVGGVQNACGNSDVGLGVVHPCILYGKGVYGGHVKKELSKLRDLLVGSTVESIVSPDKGVSEAFAKFTVRKGDVKHEFHLHATDLGWWIGEHERIKIDPDGVEVRMYEDWGDMISSVSEHLIQNEMLTLDKSAMEPLWDHKRTRFGCRCKITNREWWISSSALKLVDEQTKALLLSADGWGKVIEAVGTYGELYHLGLNK